MSPGRSPRASRARIPGVSGSGCSKSSGRVPSSGARMASEIFGTYPSSRRRLAQNAASITASITSVGAIDVVCAASGSCVRVADHGPWGRRCGRQDTAGPFIQVEGSYKLQVTSSKPGAPDPCRQDEDATFLLSLCLCAFYVRAAVKLRVDDACGRVWAAFFAVQGVARSWRHSGSVHPPFRSLLTRVRYRRGSRTQPRLLSGRTRQARGPQRLFSLEPDRSAAVPSLCRSRWRPCTARTRSTRDRSTQRPPVYAAFTIAPVGNSPVFT